MQLLRWGNWVAKIWMGLDQAKNGQLKTRIVKSKSKHQHHSNLLSKIKGFQRKRRIDEISWSSDSRNQAQLLRTKKEETWWIHAWLQHYFLKTQRNVPFNHKWRRCWTWDSRCSRSFFWRHLVLGSPIKEILEANV